MRHVTAALAVVLLMCAEGWKEYVYCLLEEFRNRFVIGHHVDQLNHQKFHLLLGDAGQINSCFGFHVDHHVCLIADVVDLCE